eukprot:TRINITY_DN1897_c0_g2_i2.p1 TRINITY_DN1897_c0_g2~~TRINITY_DN1897_c0_g2_i2.p1  ORF type:complete len:160 (+),score=19.72 TRINITY_DN1897_c0_g2_i2:433-912(+)
MEVKLWNDKREREMYDNFADLYAIIKATEKLEKAYVRDIISSSDYEPECLKLIAQFKTLASSLGNTVPSLEQFADTYKMDCPAALNRLLVAGVPATVEHRASFSGCASSAAATVAECVQELHHCHGLAQAQHGRRRPGPPAAGRPLGVAEQARDLAARV